jgi:hypothetical protein
MRAFFFLLFFLSSAARADGWDTFYQSCDDFFLPRFQPLVIRCQGTQAKLDDAKSQLTKFTDETCVAYRKRINDAAAIAEFKVEKARVDGVVVAAGREGRTLLDDLQQKFSALNRDAAAEGIGFSGGRCGIAFAERLKHLQGDLDALRKQETTLVPACNELYQAGK